MNFQLTEWHSYSALFYPGLTMKIFEWLPPYIRDFARVLQPRAVNVIQWSSLLGNLFELARMPFEAHGHENLKNSVEIYLPEHIVFLRSDDKRKFRTLKNQSRPSLKKSFGQDVLTLFFSQMACPDGMFADLRQDFFYHSISRRGQSGFLYWDPGYFRFKLDNNFREKMILVYAAHFNGDENDLRQALLNVGLLPSTAGAEVQEKVFRTILKYFGARRGMMEYKLEDFKEGFLSSFDILVEHNITLPSDFFYFGLYMFSLYHALDQTGQSFDAKKIFLNSSISPSFNNAG